MSKKLRKYIDVEVNETISTMVTISIDEIKEFISDCDQDEKKRNIKSIKRSANTRRH